MQALLRLIAVPRKYFGHPRDPLRAAQLARKAIAVDSDFAFAHACLGYVLYRSGQWEVAASHSQRALDLGLPHNQWDEAETRFILSMAQWQSGAKDDSLKTYHEAVTWIDGGGMEKDGPYPFRVEAASVLGIVDKTDIH